MSTAVRKPAARLPRPAARYWKGKAPKGADDLEPDSDYDDEPEEEVPQEEGNVLIESVGEEEEEEVPVKKEVAVKQQRAINVALRDVNISKEGRVIVAGKVESGRTEVELEQGESVFRRLHATGG